MSTSDGRVLVVDDDAAFRFAMRKALGRLGYRVDEAAGGHEGVRKLEAGDPPDAALLDLRMDDLDGLEVLRRCSRVPTKFVVLTGHGSVDAAVQAMKLGAFSFLEKPVDADILQPLLDQAIAEARRGRGAVDAGSAASDFAPPLVGTSAAMEEVRSFVARVGPTDETVALYGETGTGKEVVARHLHLRSPRKNGRFVALNAACVPRDLFESELFGHKKGAFTGATGDRLGLFREANGGTLFIDELGELPLESQAKLLRALEERKVRGIGEAREIPVDVRIVAATNRDLWSEVQAGRFREDLYFRLQVFPLRLPPLRERVEDVPELAVHLLERIGGAPRQLAADAIKALTSYEWPGNVRELLNVLRRASLFATGEVLDGELVRRMIAASVFAHPSATTTRASTPAVRVVAPSAPASSDEEMSLAELERTHIERTLARMGGNITKAATSLGIDRRTLQRKLRSYGIAAGDE
ncbi:sigma-54-dependent transcriptional regulator [Sandaracinus amylolyticus]|uniref:sigma-54-dependent transcriptional regulator n=1 Tax=Sandaracinus amylolyticus TaxID=927083 RepID=UPI001F1F2731|nr:sigma-54 dependent transcriptional regulator [Sandaracinus amylolyticus]UJR82015.1 Two-component system response regulator GlrR [Sandaracinus amylolyticus]